jgi:hypothetical protein
MSYYNNLYKTGKLNLIDIMNSDYNLYKNYYAVGLTTVETIAPKYCEGNTWAGKINWYISVIKTS